MLDVSQACKKCSQAIVEGHAYELGDDRWHIDCFKCFKCDKSLGCNSNFLVLGNGLLVCSNCSYSCKQCGKKIDDLAILTGDQAYCLGCFKCRVCKLKIEDLRYARTLKGLFCMSCHEELIAKKKKHDMKRRQMALLLAQARPASNDGHESAGSAAPSPHLGSTPGSNLGPNGASSANSSPHIGTGLSTHSGSSVGANLGSYGHSLAPSSNTLYLQRSPLSTSVSKQLPPAPAPAPAPAPVPSTPTMSTPSVAPGSSGPPGPRELAESLSSGPARPHIQSTPSYASTASVLTQRLATSNLEPRLMGLAMPRSPRRPSGSDASEHSGRNDTSASYEIEEVNDSDDELNIRQAREQLERRFMKLADELDGAILDVINAFSAPNTPATLYPSSDRGEPASSATPVLRQERNWTGDPALPHKNILLLSPNQLPDSEHPHPQRVQRAADDARRQRLAISSPMARANRQARVLETIDGNSTGELSAEPDSPSYRYTGSAITTPKRGGNGPLRLLPLLSSPPPRLALPEVPSTPLAPERSADRPVDRASERTDRSDRSERPERSERTGDRVHGEVLEARGLGLDNVDLSKARTIKPATPAVTNLEDAADDHGDGDEDYLRSPPSRLPSMRRKLLMKHKRSTSNGLGLLSSKLGFFKPKEEGGLKGHARHLLDGSVHGQAFTTPPLPFSSPASTLPYRDTHARSSSDTNFITSMENDAARREFEMRSIKSEIYQLDTRRQALLSDNMKLNSDKSKLLESLGSLLKQIELDTKKKEALAQEVQLLVLQKQMLTEENLRLAEENASLHRTVSETREQPRESAERSDRYDRHGSNVFEHNETFESNFTTESLHDEGAEAQKATRLKFWRRPKVTIASAQGPSTQNNPSFLHPNGGLPQSTSSYKLNQNGSTNTIQTGSQSSFSDESGGRKPANVNGFVSKSRSTTILDSFLNGANGSDVPLLTSSLQRRAVFENEKVPLIVTKCIEEVESRGLDVEGIYRLSGGNSAISAIESAFSAIPPNGATDKRHLAKLNEVLGGDINAVTSALKRYLRKLPDPLVPFALYENFIRIGQRVSEGASLCDDFRTRVINRLPPANKHTMYLIGKHLLRVDDLNGVNRMNFKNLSVVFAPTIARDVTGEREMVDMGYRNDATEFLFTNFNTLFEGYSDSK